MYRYITENGIPTKHIGRAAKDALGRFHAEIRLRVKRKEVRKRLWVKNEAEVVREIEKLKRNAVAAPLYWLEALGKWEIVHQHFSPEHIGNVRLNVSRLHDRVGDLPINHLALSEFNDWIQHEKENRGPRAAQHAYTSAMTVSKWARTAGLLPAEPLPFEYSPKPAHKPKERQPFTPKDLPVYAERLTEYSRPAFLFLGLSGIRVSEAFQLEDGNIKDDVAEFIQKGGTKRRLPLDDTLLALITMAREARAKVIAHAQKKGRIIAKPNRIFLNAKGTPWSRMAFLKHCQRRWEGLPHKLTHELRHGFGTIAGKQFPPDAIKAAMGHANRETSESYVHADEQTAGEVGAAVRATFLPPLKHLLPNLKTNAPESSTEVTCPHCGHKFLFSNEKGQKP